MKYLKKVYLLKADCVLRKCPIDHVQKVMKKSLAFFCKRS